MAITDHVGPAIPVEQKSKALEAVLQSETFARSGRLRDLLRFLCDAEMEGREAELTEYSIGTLALGRPADFCPLDDSSVRSRAYELRHKLEKFYLSECPEALVRIELRKGSYVPRYVAAPGALDSAEPRTVTVLETPLVAPEPVPPFQPQPKGWPNWLPVATFCAGVILAGCFAFLLSRTRLSPPAAQLWTPELEALWRPFIDGSTPAAVVVENRFFLTMGPLVVRTRSVNTMREVEASEPLMKVKHLFGLEQIYPTPNYTDAGNPGAVFYLTRLLAPRIAGMAVKSSLEISADDFRNSNIIMLCKPWTDPHVKEVLARGELIDLNGRIRNVHPRAGELSEYRDQSDERDPAGWGVKYSIITMLPGATEQRRILTLTGSGSEQPAALAYYLTNPETTRVLAGKLRDLNHPNFFQVLVRAEFKTRSVLSVSYVTARALAGR